MKFSLAVVIALAFVASLDQVLSHVLAQEDEATANDLQQRRIKSSGSKAGKKGKKGEKGACSECDDDCGATACLNSNCCDRTQCKCPGPSRFRRDLSNFEAFPIQDHLAGILDELDGNPEGSHIHSQVSIVPHEALLTAKAYIEAAYEEEAAIDPKRKGHFLKATSGEEILKVFGKENAKILLDFFHSYAKDNRPISYAYFARIEHEGDQYFPYHEDGQLTVFNLMINGEKEYTGGKLIYLTGDGPVMIPSVAGSAVVHSPATIHGVTPLEGVKYTLTMVSHPLNTNSTFGGLFADAAGGEEAL
jgi:hypothetical protein